MTSMLAVFIIYMCVLVYKGKNCVKADVCDWEPSVLEPKRLPTDLPVSRSAFTTILYVPVSTWPTICLFQDLLVSRSASTKIYLFQYLPVPRSTCTTILPVPVSTCLKICLSQDLPVPRSTCPNICLFHDLPVPQSACNMICLYHDLPVSCVFNIITSLWNAHIITTRCLNTLCKLFFNCK